MSSLIDPDERPLSFSPKLAQSIGLNGAIFVEEIVNLIELQIKEDKVDRTYWVRKSRDDLLKNHFPFWSRDVLKRTIDKLAEREIIIMTTEYNKNPTDSTLSYTINFDAFEKL